MTFGWTVSGAVVASICQRTMSAELLTCLVLLSLAAIVWELSKIRRLTGRKRENDRQHKDDHT